MNAPANNGYHFRPLPVDATAPEAWRALDRAVARWVIIHGGSPLLAQVAGWASLAEGQGDSALPLTGSDAVRHGMPALDARQYAQLRLDPMLSVVGEEQSDHGDAAFVIDDDHFYLRRNFLYEVAVAQHIRARRTARLPAGQVSAADLEVLFHGASDGRDLPQRNAVGEVLGRRLFVLTGGPGTGKTTTVLRMLLVLIKDRADRGVAAPVIRISAPTGKAAQRLSESLRGGAKGLREHAALPLPEAWQPHLHCALAAEASTLHRLLGSLGRHGGFKHHAENRLPADIVVVDEASMVDLSMLRSLLEALKDDAALIIVGDADQLTSVGTGSVLLDLVTALEPNDATELVRLHHSFRADTSLIPINESILSGDHDAFETAWKNAGEKVSRRDVATAKDLRSAIASWSRQLQRMLEKCGAHAEIPTASQNLVLNALDGLRARQLLCALREGEFGAEQVNGAIERILSSKLDGFAGATWYPGRAVMITRNDYSVGLFNGDVGLCLRDEQGSLGVWFEVTVQHAAETPIEAEAPGTDANRRVVRFAPGSLPEHQGAFAVTIHKSQGSEYGHVAVLLPPDADNRILSRQLLYTGVSRAKNEVELWTTDDALGNALATPVRRMGGMARRFALAARVPTMPLNKL